MHTLSVVSAVLALILAAFWAVISTAGLTGKLQRNRWVGVRSEETMASSAAFTLGNKVAAPGFGCAALILLIGGVLGFGGDLGFLFAVGAIIASLLVVAVAAGWGVRAAATVPPEDEGGCGSGCCSGGDESAADAAGAGCAGSTNKTAAHDPAADCGTSSCGSCALQGMCESDTPQRAHN